VSEPDDRDTELARDPSAPPRWLDESEGVPDDVIRGLQALRSKQPSPARLALIAAPFGLSAPTGGEALGSSSTGTAASSSSGALVAKILGVTLATGGLGLVFWLVAGDRAASRTDHSVARDPVSVVTPAATPIDSAPTRALDQTAAPRAPAVAGQAPANQLDAPERTDTSQDTAARPPAETNSPITRRDTPSTPRTAQRAPAGGATAPPTRTTSTYERPAAGSENPPLSETQLLAQARSAEPSRALALAEEHARRFPGSAFAQEREFVIITALVRAGNRGAAEQRARQFARNYPKSPYMARLQSLVPKAIPAD
jgi:hypothetical protein